MNATTRVHATHIIGTDIVDYTAWTTGDPMDAHGYRHYSEWQSFDGRFYGRIGSRRIPATIEAMVGGSPERVEAAHAHSAAQYEEAYAMIVAAFPHTANGRRSMGRITVHE
jgi:hypothetical protein